MTEIKHGYVRYTQGCRCDVCRAGKAAYMRERRAPGYREASAGRLLGIDYVADGIVHSYSGYQNHGCRCETCRAARAEYDASRRLVSS